MISSFFYVLSCFFILSSSLNNETEYVYTNNSDIVGRSSDIDWCNGLHLSPIFSNNSILQRAPQRSTIFGYGTPHSTVTLTFNNRNYSSRISPSDGTLHGCSFRIELPPMDDSNNKLGMQYYDLSLTSDV